MSIKLNEIQYQRVGALTASVFGLVVFLAGVRLIIDAFLLADPVQVSGVIVRSGITRSHGGWVHFVGYELKLPAASGGESSICRVKDICIRSLTPRQAAG